MERAAALEQVVKAIIIGEARPLRKRLGVRPVTFTQEIDDEDLKDAGEIHDEHELDERQKHAESVHTYGVGHEAEHADGRA